MDFEDIIDLFFFVIAIIAIIGLFVILISDKEYTLHCVDVNGIESTYDFIGFEPTYLKEVEICNKIQFQPVDYYVTEK
jgi:hypothetical protein